MTYAHVDGLAGQDQLILRGTTGREIVQLLPGSGTFLNESSGISGQVISMEYIEYYAQGNDDQVTFYDSAGADVFTGRKEWSRMYGSGYQNWAFNAGLVVGVAAHGGFDRANLFDTAGNDVYIATAVQAGFDTTGVGVRSFEKVVAFSSTGNDRAVLHGTTGDDIFSGRASLSVLRGAGYYNQVNGFDRVVAHAKTGTDVSKLWGDAGSETFVGRPTDSVLSGAGYRLEAHGFDRVISYAAAGGTDLAILYDSAGNDRFGGAGNLAQIVSPAAITRAIGFNRVTIYGTAGGINRRTLTDPLYFTLNEQGTWV